MGSFEIYFRGFLVFSKLKTGLWPNPSAISKTIRDVIDGVHELKDPNSGKSKNASKKPEVPRLSKVSSQVIKKEQYRPEESPKKLNPSSSQTARVFNKKSPSFKHIEEKKTLNSIKRNSSKGLEGGEKLPNIEKKVEIEVYKNETVEVTQDSTKRASLKQTKEEAPLPAKQQNENKGLDLTVPPVQGHESKETFYPVPLKNEEPGTKLTQKAELKTEKEPENDFSDKPSEKLNSMPPLLIITEKPESYSNTFEAPNPENNYSKEKSSDKSSESSSKSKHADNKSDSESEFTPKTPITDSFKVALPVGQGKNSKLSLKNTADSVQTFIVSIKNPRLIKLSQTEYIIEPGYPQKLSFEILKQDKVGISKGYIIVTCNSQTIYCYELVVDTQ